MKNILKTFAMAVLLTAAFSVSGYSQATLRSTTLSAAIAGPNVVLAPPARPDTIITVGSTSGVTVGMTAFVLQDSEAMTVKVVNSSTQLTVTRGTNSTVATPHVSGATIYIDLPQYFVKGPLYGGCTSAQLLVLPTVDLSTGIRYDCVSSQWNATGGPIKSLTSPTIASPTITGTTTITGATTITPTSSLTLGVAGTAVGQLLLKNATSGTITLAPTTGALGTVTATFPAAAITVSGVVATDCATANACSPTTKPSMKIVEGISAAADNASPSTIPITAISPAFTGTTTYACIGNLEGGTAAIAAKGLAVANVSGSAFTFTTANTSTEKAHYVCIGY